MSAYVIFDVEIRDPARYQEFMNGVKPALEKAGAKYLARGGSHKVYEGDWQPRFDPSEVASILTPTLRELADPALHRFLGTREWMGVHYSLHEYQIHTPPLWGATARMVRELLHHLDLGPAPQDEA